MPDELPPTGGAELSPRLRRTPCVGVCSTTYGDLVCRGCKRFAHEIVAWNGYAEHQRDVVWLRLRTLLAESVRAHLRVVDEDKLRAAARAAGIDTDMPVEALAFHTARVHTAALASLGLAARTAAPLAAAEAARAVDREFYLRSQAHYEASFKTLA